MAQTSCPRFPTGEVREIIKRTNETGNEHAFVRCPDGSTSDIIKGGKSQMNVSDAVESCDIGPQEGVDIIHTHPNGVDRLSDRDRQTAAQDDVESVCVAVDGGDVVCEMVDKCERSV